MKIFIKNNIKIISAIIITAVLCVSGTVYATTKYLSSDVTYKDTTVENALNELYDNNYSSKTYTQEGLVVYDNRITIIDGGYYIDKDNITWVNITFKTNVLLIEKNIWLLFEGLPTVKDNFIISDVSRKYAFCIGNANNRSNSINFFDHVGNYLPKDEIITLRFKY